ncbi:hypothetical protein QWJ90_14795 [Microbacterium oryzae]|uniref:hypothetical protein n=1 Tax=Microbacterium oryzae TaxID=743009 RepID=UPI0025B1CB3E|nr:hypothetical protein [Microbacterium oryzae]MDN3312198.1 hypothetical protein [Microbacterium oryzae]
MRTMKRAAFALTLGALAGVLAGCDGEAPWVAATTPTPTTSVEPTYGSGAGESAPATETPEPVVNDLETGSAKRQLDAGAVVADVTYWSDLALDQWTAAAAKPLSLSLSTTITPDDGQGVYLQRASITVVPDGGEALPVQEDTSTEPHGYLVLSPYSYSQTFTIGAVPDGTRSVTLQVRYEFLVQTTPTSDEYAKQTATDSLTVAIAG